MQSTGSDITSNLEIGQRVQKLLLLLLSLLTFFNVYNVSRCLFLLVKSSVVHSVAPFAFSFLYMLNMSMDSIKEARGSVGLDHESQIQPVKRGKQEEGKLY